MEQFVLLLLKVSWQHASDLPRFVTIINLAMVWGVCVQNVCTHCNMLQHLLNLLYFLNSFLWLIILSVMVCIWCCVFVVLFNWVLWTYNNLSKDNRWKLTFGCNLIYLHTKCMFINMGYFGNFYMYINVFSVLFTSDCKTVKTRLDFS